MNKEFFNHFFLKIPYIYYYLIIFQYNIKNWYILIDYLVLSKQYVFMQRIVMNNFYEKKCELYNYLKIKAIYFIVCIFYKNIVIFLSFYEKM